MKIKATRDFVKIEFDLKSIIPTGEYKARTATVELSSDFDDLTVIAVFKPNYSETAFESVVSSGTCEIPTFEKGCDVEVGVYGYSVDNDNQLTKRVSPKTTKFKVYKGSFCDSETPPTPTPGAFAELKSEIDAVREAGENGDYVTDNSVTTAKIDKNLFRDNIVTMNSDTVAIMKLKPEIGKLISISASVKNGSITAEKIADGVIPDVSEKENISNKTTSISSASTNTEYPSAKAVYDALPDVSAKESISNKVTALSENSTDTEYPSAKAVRDEIQPMRDITVVGKNKIDNNTLIAGYFINQNTGIQTVSASYKCTDFIEVEANTNYVFSSSPATYTAFRYALYNSSKAFIYGGIGSTQISTTSENAYIRLSDLSTKTELMLEAGTAATAYEAFGSLVNGKKISYDSFILNLPSKIYALVGAETNIYFDNIVADHDKNYTFGVTCEKGNHLERCYRITPVAADVGSYSLTISATNMFGVTVEKTTTLIVTAATTGSGTTKNVIVLGDSTTAANTPIVKLHTDFDSDVMSVNTFGTLGTAPNKHEGRSGWGIGTYVGYASVGGVTNPFYNSSTNAFDAENYFSSTGISAPDYFIVNLGINDFSSITSDSQLQLGLTTSINRMNTIVNSVLAVNSTIKVCIALTIPPNNSQDAFGKAYKCRTERNRYKKNNACWVDKLIKTYDNRESERIYLIPIFTNLDTVYNMGLESVAVNARNAATYNSPVANGGVHPDESGYWQIADCYWCFIKSNAAN